MLQRELRNLSQSREFYCPITDGYITEKQCVQFHVGVRPLNDKNVSDFPKQSLPCLSCEGLVRSRDDIILTWPMLGAENLHKFLPAYYNNFFVLAHNYDYLLEKFNAMLDMMNVRKDEKWVQFGYVYHDMMKDEKKAQEAFEKACALNDAISNVYHLAKFHINRERYELALQLLTEAFDTHAAANYLRGICFEKLGQMKKAMKYFEHSLSLKEDEETYNKLAYIYFSPQFYHPEKSKQYFDGYISDAFIDRRNNMSKKPGAFHVDRRDVQFLHYAMVLYDLKEYDRTLAYIRRLMKDLLNYETPADIQLMIEENLFVPDEIHRTPKQKEYSNEARTFLMNFVGQIHLLRAKCLFQLNEPDEAKRYIRLAHQFLEAEEEVEIWLEKIEASLHEEDSIYFLRLLQYQGFDLAEIKDKVENIHNKYVQLKLEMDAKFHYFGEFVEDLRKRYGNIQDGQKLMKNELEKLKYEKLVELDEKMKPELKKLSKQENFQPVGDVVELISTSDFLFLHFKPIFENEDETKLDEDTKMDSTFVVVSYFKALEVFLAKKLSSIAPNRPTLKFDYDRKKKQKVLKENKRIRIGTPRFYRETFFTYYSFIENFTPNNPLLPENFTYVEEEDPVKKEYAHDRAQIVARISDFVDKYRNTFSHKATLQASDVGKLRDDFYELLKELLEKLK